MNDSNTQKKATYVMHLFEFQLKVKKNIIQTMLKNISTYYHPYILFIFREEEWEEVVSE